MIRWFRAWRRRCELRAWEVHLFNHGSLDKWQQVRDANSAAGVWKRWPL
jgi:hypothetical protein